MKNLFLFLSFLVGASISAQHHLSKEKLELIQKIKTEKIITELQLSGQNRAKFTELYQEYHSEKQRIISKFKGKEITDQMSEEQALEKINESFEVAQKLLDNRKFYIQKFLKILTPKQVLQIHKIEKSWKDDFKRKHHHKKSENE